MLTLIINRIVFKVTFQANHTEFWKEILNVSSRGIVTTYCIKSAWINKCKVNCNKARPLRKLPISAIFTNYLVSSSLSYSKLSIIYNSLDLSNPYNARIIDSITRRYIIEGLSHGHDLFSLVLLSVGWFLSHRVPTSSSLPTAILVNNYTLTSMVINCCKIELHSRAPQFWLGGLLFIKPMLTLIQQTTAIRLNK